MIKIYLNAQEVKTLRRKLSPLRRLRVHTTIIPILECARITVDESSKVTLELTNLEVYVFFSFTPEAPAKGTGTFLIEFDNIWKFIYNAVGEVVITVNEPKHAGGLRNMSLEDGDFKASFLEGGKDAEFVKAPVLGVSVLGLSGEAREIGKVLGRMAPWCSDDDLRPAMTGVCFWERNKKLEIVATDAHTLYHVPLPDTISKNEKRCILPKIGAVLVSECVTEGVLNLACDGKMFKIGGDGYTIYVRAIDARFPDWEGVLPECTISFVVKRKQLKAFLKLAMQFVNRSTHQVIFQVTSTGICASGGDVDFSIDFNYKLPVYAANPANFNEFKFAVNMRYLQKAAGLSDDDLLKISSTGSPTKGFCIDDDLLLMPLMTND